MDGHARLIIPRHDYWRYPWKMLKPKAGDKFNFRKKTKIRYPFETHSKPKETIIMPYSLARLKVEDYAKWKPVFDQISAARRASGGAKKGILLQDSDNPNEITILIEWDTLENARKFVQSDEVKKSLKKSGSIKSDFYFLREVEQIKI